jgi:glutamine amidotransferase
MKLVIIDYGAGNLFSVQKAFERLGLQPIVSVDKEIIQSADLVVFPGVGHAQTAMRQLKASNLDQLVPTLKQPVLGICLGMQLMTQFSEEGNTEGLGIFDTKTRSLAKMIGNTKVDYAIQIPHMGWNDVRFQQETGSYYFVHGYAAEICDQTWGKSEYGIPFSAALRKNNFYGVQFHPEKSGKNGENLLNQFITNSFEIL